jgi:hypothetical protein
MTRPNLAPTGFRKLSSEHALRVGGLLSPLTSVPMEESNEVKWLQCGDPARVCQFNPVSNGGYASMNRRPCFVSDYSHVSRQQPVQQIPISLTHPTKEKKSKETESQRQPCTKWATRRTRRQVIFISQSTACFRHSHPNIHIPLPNSHQLITPSSTIHHFLSPFRVYVDVPFTNSSQPGQHPSRYCGVWQ